MKLPPRETKGDFDKIHREIKFYHRLTPTERLKISSDLARSGLEFTYHGLKSQHPEMDIGTALKRITYDNRI